VHKLLLHSECLWCGFEDRYRYPVYDQCAVAIQGFPLGYPPPVIPTLLKMRTGEALAPHFHQLTTLSIVIRTKSLLVQRQSPVSHSYTVDDVFSSKIADTVQI